MSDGPSAEIQRMSSIIEAVDRAVVPMSAALDEVISPHWNVVDQGQPTWERLASGVERLGKLTLGLRTEIKTGVFPPDREMKQLWHEVDHIANEVTKAVAEWANANGNQYVEDLARAVEIDPYWSEILEALTTAVSAANGRYRAQGELGGAQPSTDPPSAAWEEAERNAITDLGLMADLSGPQNRQIIVQAREQLAHSILRWWHMVFRAWQHGFCGEDGRRASTEVSRSNRWVSTDELREWVKRDL